MPQCQRPNPRRRTGAFTPPTDPLAAMAFAVAALQRTLAQAAPRDAPAIARQLVAAAKEWEAALERKHACEQAAARAAAEEQREREIGDMAAALERVFPEKPWNWGEASYREIAEAMHGDGMMDEVMVLSLLTPDAAAAPSPRWPHAPAQPELADEDFDWEGFAAELVMQREQEAAKAAAQSGRDETNAPPHTPAREAPPPPPPGPRVRML